MAARRGQSPDELTPAAVMQRLQAVVDSSGRVHIVYEDCRAGPDHLRLVHALWDHRWFAPNAAHDIIDGSEPALSCIMTVA